MNKGLKKDVETLNDSFSQYQVMRKAIEKSGTLVAKLSKYYNLILGDEECNEEYYQAIYDTDFDVDIFEAEVIDEMAKLLIALHVLMLSMNSKKRVNTQKQFYGKKLEGKGCKQMKLCNKDCFHCIYNNCIYDDCNKSVITNEERKEQNKERKRQYYQEHKEEVKLYKGYVFITLF